MNSSLLAAINFVFFLILSFFLAGAIAREHWRASGKGAVVFLILLCGQVWLVPQAINFLAFHSTRLLYPLWFGNWIGSAASVVFFSFVVRGSSRDLLDAARLDGAGFLAIQGQVIWPIVRPPLLALAVILLMATWTEFAHPLFVATGRIPTAAFAECAVPTEPRDLAILFAVSIVATLPVIGLHFLAQRTTRHVGA